MRKVSRERELISQKQADLVALQEEIKSLTKERDQLARRVKKNGIYSKYMDSVVQASGQFQNAHQVMSRYDSLKRMRKELLQRTLQMQDSIERTRAQLTHITEQDNNTLLYHNNTLARQRSKLDKAQAECMVWESKWAHVQNTAAQKTLLLGTIKMAILNIYQMVCKRAKGTGEVPIAPEDALKLLNKIQTCLSDLISICEEVKRLPSYKVI
ncbi:coiled-coil domain-containing protein 42-like [Salminus brasiliensis]|uniref:coiled-coil domain-containing protein 42-like n=1 Tax=Salminus brasiliensis TaxID=930266 RepID=UPI003B82CA7E